MSYTHSSENQQTFEFLKGKNNVFNPKKDSDFDWKNSAEIVRVHLSEATNAKNILFLLGSGCSSLKTEGKEVGIPTMKPMAEKFVCTQGDESNEFYLTETELNSLSNDLGIDITKAEYKTNLERILEVLFSYQFVLQHADLPNKNTIQPTVETAIDKLKKYILNSCTTEISDNGICVIHNLYKSFYRKLIFRNRSLPKPWIFTTNYDLFNESALDHLGIQYSNGFSGLVERQFNPSTFNYALAEQLDISGGKWNVVDNFVYFCKLHGSINWIEKESGIFPIKELQNVPSDDVANVLIFPTPLKQTASLSSPYSDIFRQFYLRTCREQTVLFVIGYSFGDEHVNNIIFQALTIPTFRLVIFAAPDSEGTIENLRELDDPRIWIIGGDGPEPNSKAHYFKTVIEEFLPELPSTKVESAVEAVSTNLMSKNVNAEINGKDNDF